MTLKIENLCRTAVIAAALIALPGLALAQHQQRPDAKHGNGEMMERILDRLELSEAQRTEVEALKARFEGESGTSRDQVRVLRGNLAKTIHGVEFDEQAIRDAAAELAAIEADVAVARALHLQEFRAILTPEQQDELASIHETVRMMKGDRGAGRRSRSHD
jgi:Spy/CpxP family protein refolding chaperone